MEALIAVELICRDAWAEDSLRGRRILQRSG